MNGFVFDQAAFEDALESPPVRPARSVGQVSRVSSVAPVARATVTGTETGRTFLTKPPAEWTWKDLQSYVVTKIEEYHGAFVRRPTVEFGIFNAFAGRYKDAAGPIAVYAFETQAEPGRWRGAPISVSRFSKGSDPYFADVIVAKIRQR